MKTVALISGGKDSCYNMMCCVAEDHEIVALANLRPEKEDQHELDSYMFQTVGHTAIDLYAEAMGLPLYVQTISGESLSTGGTYTPHEGDEVEDLYKLLQAVKDDIAIEAVSVGAILSDYQRVRVENVCGRLGLTVLAYLWRRDQEELLQEMIDCGVKAKIIKVAAMGLQPQKHLGLELSEIFPHMIEMKQQYGLNVCGEGGEYETFVCDCPLFQQKIVINKSEKVIHSDDAFAPVGYLVLKSCSLSAKSSWDPNTPLKEKLLGLPVLTNHMWLERQGLALPYSIIAAEGSETDPDPSAVVTEGAGDSGLPTVYMCVPDVNFSGVEPPTFKTDGSNFQVSCVRAIVGPEMDLTQATELAMNQLKECLLNHNMKMEDILIVSLGVGEMSNFATINSIYKKFFDINPPVRVCVEANLPRNIALQIDCQGKVRKQPDAESDDITEDRKVLHVQGLSHWAPANIGPYSQAVIAEGKLYMAGIVPLIPANLSVVAGGFDNQCSLALLHVRAVMSVISPGCTLRNCPLVTCYLTKSEYIERAQSCWDTALKETDLDDASPIVELKLVPHIQYVEVAALPKGCLVEWHISAWPNMEDTQIKVIREVKQYDKYSIHAVAQCYEEKPEFFTCNITVDAPSMDIISRHEKHNLPKRVVELYCQVCHQSGTTSSPLAKVFFSPVFFDYAFLHKYFTEAVSSLCAAKTVAGPVVSLIPVSGLDSSKQILAWCQ